MGLETDNGPTKKKKRRAKGRMAIEESRLVWREVNMSTDLRKKTALGNEETGREVPEKTGGGTISVRGFSEVKSVPVLGEGIGPGVGGYPREKKEIGSFGPGPRNLERGGHDCP